jgi:uncharacterized membrane protein
MENKAQNRLAAISMIAVFVVTIAAFAAIAFTAKRLLSQYIQRDEFLTAASFIIAAALTLILLYGFRRINRHLTKDKN